MSDLQIQSVTFMEDSAVVQYVDLATDVRGALLMQHQITLSAQHPDYRDDIEGLHHKAKRMLANALEDFENTEPVDPRAKGETGEDEPDEMGGGTYA